MRRTALMKKPTVSGVWLGDLGRAAPQHEVAQHHRLEQAPDGPERQRRTRRP